MNRKTSIGYKIKDLLDEKSFDSLEKMGYKFFRDKKTGRRLRIIKKQWQR